LRELPLLQNSIDTIYNSVVICKADCEERFEWTSRSFSPHMLQIIGIANDFGDLLTDAKTKEIDRNGTD